MRVKKLLSLILAICMLLSTMTFTVSAAEKNIYDLSAVVSYFGTEDCVDSYPEYAKYDLNRDGVIDSKDVAYVLVSWNN